MIRLNIEATENYEFDDIIIDEDHCISFNLYTCSETERYFWNNYASFLFDVYSFKKKFKPWGKLKKWLFPAGYLNYLINFIEGFNDYVNYVCCKMNNKTANIFKDIKL